jgi:hypothetical protein
MRFGAEATLHAARQSALILSIEVYRSSKPEGRSGSRYPPHAFTEQGAAMLSSVLCSERAVQLNIQIMRTFVKRVEDDLE